MANRLTIIFFILLLLPAVQASGDDGYQVISGDLILDVTRSYMLSNSPWDEYDIDIGVKRELADIPAYISGKVELEVECDDDLRLADVNLIRVRIDIAGSPYARINVGPYISVNLPIVVANGDIERGWIITEKDLKIATKDLSEKRLNDPILETSSIIGMEAKQRIKDSTAVMKRHLIEPLLVERGKGVVAVVIAQWMKVTLSAIALDNGRMGETVRVKNSDTGKIITGIVIGKSEVEVRI